MLVDAYTFVFLFYIVQEYTSIYDIPIRILKYSVAVCNGGTHNFYNSFSFPSFSIYTLRRSLGFREFEFTDYRYNRRLHTSTI